MPHPDQRYIQALLDNDRTTLSDIYRRFMRRVESYVCANSGTADDAADVFQDSLLTIDRQARRPEGLVLTCAFEAYLMMVCRGRWLNELDRRKRAGVTNSDLIGWKGEEDTTANALADHTLLEADRDQLFWQQFERLPENCRQLLRLAWTGIGMDEVASTLKMTYGYARKRKSECVAHLTKSIQSSPNFSALT
jgi:RNA polymerase sigma factor (sigma-70 family)